MGTETINHFITLQEASQMVARYKTEIELMLDPKFRGLNILAKCESFDRTAFDTVLAQPGCKSIRIHYGMDATLKVKAILVGVDVNGHELVPADANAPNSQIIDRSTRCPDECPVTSVLGGY
jgi:hypothetical protein